MNSMNYKAFVVHKSGDSYQHSIQSLSMDDLPDNDVIIQVRYSSLNYKDMLSATGHQTVTKQYPFTPGVDAAGVVINSKDSRFTIGDKVIVTSYDLGMNTPGGFGQIISVPGDWIVPLPDNLSLIESMMIGTSGLTAAMGVKKIVDAGITPERLPVVVSGGTGAVGTFSVALLSHLGYRCDVITGKTDQHNFLKLIGSSSVIERDDFYSVGKKPLLPSKWIAGIDTVGGKMLDLIIRQIAHNGLITCCGNVLGDHLETSIYPFILRGISLMGIDSGIAHMKDRLQIWSLLAGDWKLSNMADFCTTIKLKDLSSEIQKVKDGVRTGKTVIQLPD
ncbi:MAG: YhdH/YhfP family quinone oxidoreductase [Balneolaceae bacterium]